MLKMNGKVFFLDRPLKDLEPDKNRPTANSYESIKKLYDERLYIYRENADAIIRISGPPSHTANLILEKYYI